MHTSGMSAMPPHYSLSASCLKCCSVAAPSSAASRCCCTCCAAATCSSALDLWATWLRMYLLQGQQQQHGCHTHQPGAHQQDDLTSRVWLCSAFLKQALALSPVFTQTTCSADSRPEAEGKSGTPVQASQSSYETLCANFCKATSQTGLQGCETPLGDCSTPRHSSTAAVRTVGVT
jgi:hypothetical protein